MSQHPKPGTTQPPGPQRLAVLVSGNGSNLQAILDAGESLPAQVVCVVSNKSSAFGLERARSAGIPALAKPNSPGQDRRKYDAELANLLESYTPDWIILAGWMRLLTSEFLNRFPGKVINLHPALPGAFPGVHAIARAFDAYQQGEITQTGVMVHLVPDEGVDSGPVLAQESVPILPRDTLESLEARVHAVEHRLLVETLRKVSVQTPTVKIPVDSEKQEIVMPKAILSVHDKNGLTPFATALVELGWTLLASGGTARLLREAGLPVTEVADYTHSPEILGGRVKTLHPAIHGGLLARPTEDDLLELEQLGWGYIDLVAVNLYPFEQTIARPDVSLEDAIENIDIGGVTLIRAAAKNHARVTLVCDPGDYTGVLVELKSGGVQPATRQRLAVKGFQSTARYDTAIAAYLAQL